jgi:phospholipid/cholesterol/gamma-HCH transport system permease protein
MSVSPAPPASGRWRSAAVEFGRNVDATRRVAVGVGRLGPYLGEVIRQAGILISGSLLIVMGLVFALGGVVGIEAAYGARLVGAPSAAGAFTAIGNLRELTPYAFGYMMAAKVSTGYVAEIGTMRITEEIDALDVMGIRSLVWLGSTRLLATWLVMPFMYALGVLIAFAASFVTVVGSIGQVSAGGYLELFWKFQSVGDYAGSFAKGMAMATFVVLVGICYGYRVQGGPVEVGRATARAMIVDLIGIHIIGILGSQIFWGGGNPRLPIGA